MKFKCPRIAGAVNVLRQLPGRRLFQYRTEGGAINIVTASDVNLFLRDIAGVRISLKDFRTLVASGARLRRWPRLSRRAANVGGSVRSSKRA
jgi:DNA topoisomerase-1